MKLNRSRGPRRHPAKPIAALCYGDRVAIVGSQWDGEAGAYIGPEETPVGTLRKVRLDNGFDTLVPLHRIRKI